MTLERELEIFQRELPRLLVEGQAGKHVLIHGDLVDSVWPTWEEAVEAGYERFELEPFVVKLIAEHEPIYFPRAVVPCP